MQSANYEPRLDHYALAEELRIGLYIHVDLPWFQHPFTLNSFKIRSKEQIRDLRALGVRQFRYSPEFSDQRPESSIAVPQKECSSPASGEEPDPEPQCDPAMAEKHARVQQLHEYRRAITQAKQAFVKARAVVSRLKRNLLASPKESLEEMAGLVDQMATVFLERPQVTLHFMGDNGGAEETFYHELNVSILCMMLAKGLDLSGEQARLLGAGALLHDIGLMDVPAAVQRKDPEEYTRPERELRAMHVDYGVKIGRQVGVRPEVLSIIAQHHELVDGSGYPRRLAIEQITPLARVVSLVNFYDNLCNPVVVAKAMTPHEALSFLFSRQRSKFDARILNLMIRSLGVYPPGSIVKLSNEGLAVVVTVNPRESLRPWVLLYDATVPRDEAIMLNLETEPDVSIIKAVRPAVLPSAVYAYLSPRKRITYFFDADSPTAPGR